MDSANFLNCWETLEGVVTTIIEKSTMKVQQNYIIRQSAAKTLSLLGMGKVQRLFRKEVGPSGSKQYLPYRLNTRVKI